MKNNVVCAKVAIDGFLVSRFEWRRGWAVGTSAHEGDFAENNDEKGTVAENNDEKDKKRILQIVVDAGAEGVLKQDLTRKTQFIRMSLRDEHLEDFVKSGEFVMKKALKAGRYSPHRGTGRH